MNIDQFIGKWTRADRTERQAAQEHFIDLCRLLSEPTPNEGDADAYSFEKGLSKVDGGGGFADVWKRGHFGWEYKKDRANLDRAYQQLLLYSVALENPPLLVVSDTKRFRVYTNWTNTVQQVHDFTLDDLRRVETRELLHSIFRNPEKLKPAKTREQVTREAANKFSTIAERLRMQGHAPEDVAHFLNRLVFCLFAEDVNLLPDDLFSRLLGTLAKRREEVKAQSQKMLSELFANMQKGGAFGLEHILHFNGGLFDDDKALPLDPDSLDILREIAKQDWSAIDPTIFGTLFERFLDPDKRAQIGAHYTDAEKIMMIVEPVILRPLTAEWEEVRSELREILSKNRAAKGPGPAALSRAEERLDRFMKRLVDVRVLDPACGSGNFLYLALQSLKDLERRAIVEAVDMGMQLRVLHTGPENVKGIEINQYAAELARTSIWIGNIQWLRRNGFEARKEPVLDALDSIECRDALVRQKEDGTYEEAVWPEAEFIIGNPPFLGGKVMLSAMGEEYVRQMRNPFQGRLSEFADLVCYWFDKANRQLDMGKTKRAGLVATNSIRGGANRRVLEDISSKDRFIEAWSDEPWVVEGAAVRVSIVCFGNREDRELVRLDGQEVENIYSDLTGGASDLTTTKRLQENDSVCFEGGQKHGRFELSQEMARDMLLSPINPNGRPNSDVVFHYLNAADVVRRPSNTWIIFFPDALSEREAALYEKPFEFARVHVKPVRDKDKDKRKRNFWWRHHRSRPDLRKAIENLSRVIVTPVVSKWRIFVWVQGRVLATNLVDVVARDDDVAFGALHSRFHEAWSLRLGTSLEDRPRYTPTTTFETFPFPSGLTPNIPAKDYEHDPRAVAIAKAAKRLDELRNAWLNPPDLIDMVPEVVPGYPDRILPKNEKAAAELKKRTLTNLYNQRPQWLDDAHRDLDAAVAAAYGWPADISEEDALAKLLELNLARAGAGDLLSQYNGEDDDDDDDGRAAKLLPPAKPAKKRRKKK